MAVDAPRHSKLVSFLGRQIVAPNMFCMPMGSNGSRFCSTTSIYMMPALFPKPTGTKTSLVT
eukprot:1661284-Pyramimonas_sp.AAC.1